MSKDIRHLREQDVAKAAKATYQAIKTEIAPATRALVFGIPRGGVHALTYLMEAADQDSMPNRISIQPVSRPEAADVILDDLIDSGATMAKYANQGQLQCALFSPEDCEDEWLQFPWEAQNSDETIEENFVRLLQYVGDDPGREGLLETPKRMRKAWDFWCSGYGQDPKEVLKVFEDGGEGVDQMVVVKDIPFYSQCEHHLAPFFGTITIAYIPNGKIVGLSKLSRVSEIFARRLQVQERLTKQIADALEEHLQPIGVGVLIKARHMCMESRGICKQGSTTITNALRGVFKDDPKVRSEFMSIDR